MKSRIFLFFAAVLLLFPVAVHAEWERTVSASDTRLPDDGKLQLTLWGGYWETALEHTSIELKEIDGKLKIAYGLTENWSLTLVPSYYSWDFDPGPSNSGLSDTVVMTTYRFMDEAESGWGMAIQGNLYVPTGDGDKGLGTDRFASGAKLLLSKKIGPFIGVVNLGGDMIFNSRDYEKDWVGEAVLEGIYPLTGQLSLNMALSGKTKRFDGSEEKAEMGVGFRFTPKRGDLFLAGMGYTSFTDLYDWGMQLAVGVEF